MTSASHTTTRRVRSTRSGRQKTTRDHATSPGVSGAVESASRDWVMALRHGIRHRPRFPWRGVGAVVVRGVIILVDYIVVMVTAMNVIPTIGVWLHQQSPVNLGQVTVDGVIALWVMPFVFVVVMIIIGELWVLRWWWRAGTWVIARFRRHATSQITTTGDTTETTTDHDTTDTVKEHE